MDGMTISPRPRGPRADGDTLLLLTLGEQAWALPVGVVRDVLGEQRASPVPLAPDAIAGVLNLRGRIVTVLDLRLHLGLPPRAEGAPAMHVVVEAGGALYALRVDGVSEVIPAPEGELEANPQTLPPALAAFSLGVLRHGRLLVLRLDASRLLATLAGGAA